MRNVKYRKLHAEAITPRYAHGPYEDAAVDLFSREYVYILPGRTAVVKTGISIELEPGLEAQIRSRSGLALKYGVFVLNSPGTIDPGYRGEIGVILFNAGEHAFTVTPGDRIAQMVIARYEKVLFELVEEMSISGRGEAGFGSTGR